MKHYQAYGATVLQQLNRTHQQEPRNQYINTNDRPDIIAFDAQSGCDIELDISVAHPWAKHIISQAALEDGAAAAKREAVNHRNMLVSWTCGATLLTVLP